MLERYTQKSRRVLQFARKNASNAGATSIESPHLLLGILQETPSVIRDHFPQKLEQIKSELAGQEVQHVTPPEQDLALSNECKRILAYAAEEAERLGHRHIGTEHLFLGVLREEECLGAKVLRTHGINVQGERLRIARHAALHGVTSRRVDEFSALGFGSGVIVGRVASGSTKIEFRNADDDSIFGTAPGFDLPRLGDEISLGKRKGRITGVIYHYAPIPEGRPVAPQRIAIYVQLQSN